MQPLTRTARFLAAAVLIMGGAVPAAGPALAAGAPGGGCTGYSAGSGWFVSCGAGAGAASGTGGNHTTSGPACYWVSGVSHYFPGLPPAPQGFVWLVQVCPPGAGDAGPGATTFSAPVLAAAGGALAPAVLAQQAWQELAPPLPDAATAPPRGSDALAGLPEWFWVPAAQWRPVTSPVVQAGGVWAQVTATPSQLVFTPGAGMGPAGCAGPGTAYDPALPAPAQHTACSYTYTQSSGGLPGDVYAASVSITWAAAWRGSGGTGGVLAPKTTTEALRLPVAEAQALNPGGQG